MATKNRTYKISGINHSAETKIKEAYTDDFKQSVRIGTLWLQNGYTVRIVTWNETTQKYEVK